MDEKLILANLFLNDEYSRKVFPYLKAEYFQEPECVALFGLFKDYTNKYQNIPSVEAIGIELSRKDGLADDAFKGAVDFLKDVSVDDKTDHRWLVDTTEEFCRERAVYNAAIKTFAILSDKKSSRGDIFKMLQDALAVNFDTNLGHRLFKDYKERFAWYNDPVVKIHTGLDILNHITEGGFERKSLNVFMAPTGVGKTMIMCSLAAAQLMKGMNIVYFTLEMADKKIAQRLDANLLRRDINGFRKIGLEAYTNGMEDLIKRSTGEFIVKEYPPTQASVSHFRHHLDELAIKQKFVPDIIYVDYLNLCAAAGLKDASPYDRVKRVAEEMRGLAVERDICMVSATQTNRTGFQSSDFDMDAVADSFGLPMTVDFFLALISSEDLAAANQLECKQLKNRYGDKDKQRRFILGVEKSQMRFFMPDETLDLIDNVPDLTLTEKLIGTFGQPPTVTGFGDLGGLQ